MCAICNAEREEEYRAEIGPLAIVELEEWLKRRAESLTQGGTDEEVDDDRS